MATGDGAAGSGGVGETEEPVQDRLQNEPRPVSLPAGTWWL